MLKDSTMQRYTVKQLAKHLDKKSHLFYYDSAYKELLIEHERQFFFYCSIIEQNKHALIELIKEHTWKEQATKQRIDKGVTFKCLKNQLWEDTV